MADKTGDNVVQSIERALTILETLSRHGGGLGVTELGQRLGLHKSTVHRLLGTLQSFGYVEQEPDTERYRPGIKVVELGLQVLEKLDFRKEALPFLKELVDVSRETVQLGVLDDGEVVVLERDNYPELITLNLGLRMPVHCSAAGKVLLAYLDTDRVVELLREKGMPAFTPNTITELDYMLSHLEKVRAQGYAIGAEEHMEGVRAVAAPVFNHNGQVLAAVSITGPTARLSLERISRLITVLREACAGISARLGYGALARER